MGIESPVARAWFGSQCFDDSKVSLVKYFCPLQPRNVVLNRVNTLIYDAKNC